MQNSEPHQSLYLQLKKEMHSVGRDLSQSMHQVVEALEERNGVPSERLSPRMEALREREDTLNEICLKILGGRKGKPPELRWTGCAHRVLSLMSRVSEEIAAMARQIDRINEGPALQIAEDLPEMGRMASEMLERSIQTAIHPDAESARRVMEEDSSLDRRRDDFARRALSFVNDPLQDSRPVVPYVLVSRHLERIGDHASHIAEEVAYYLRGRPA